MKLFPISSTLFLVPPADWIVRTVERVRGKGCGHPIRLWLVSLFPGLWDDPGLNRECECCWLRVWLVSGRH